MLQRRTALLAAVALASTLAGGLIWRAVLAPDCEPAVRLVLLAEGREPWMWSKTPARYRVSVTGPNLNGAVWFERPFKGATGSPGLTTSQHEKGVVAFVVHGQPERFKVALDLDDQRLFERDLALEYTHPCQRQTRFIHLPLSVAAIVDGAGRAP